ncbi:MAG: FAD-dependent oxidoreductase [Gammaproteobacteria bacterium]|nr:FAD-dependent oxidoreductase [Gammaproteobacteria bacterium]
MTAEKYDVVIIGGGINGVGVAQAAAAMGYSVLLLEKNAQLALETSGRSSKLIHGGLRYLESLEFSLVRESLKERELLLKLAPDLVRLQTFNIPVYNDTSRSALTLRLGLSLYALFAGLNKKHFYHQVKSVNWSELDGLQTKNLKTVFQYSDAQTDDTALTRAVMASAIGLGAECQCEAEFVRANVDKDKVTIQYQKNGVLKTVTTSALVNASGPWVCPVNKRIFPQSTILKPDLIQGSHLLVKTAISQAYYLEAPQDKRAVFLLPWKSHALLGTTEHVYQGDPVGMHVLDEEKNYLLKVYEHYFPEHEQELLATTTGCRVLLPAGASLSKRSREIHFEVDDAMQPRVISIVGGKLTVYRQTAIKIMSVLRKTLPVKKVIADTARLKLTPID